MHHRSANHLHLQTNSPHAATHHIIHQLLNKYVQILRTIHLIEFVCRVFCFGLHDCFWGLQKEVSDESSDFEKNNHRATAKQPGAIGTPTNNTNLSTVHCTCLLYRCSRVLAFLILLALLQSIFLASDFGRWHFQTELQPQLHFPPSPRAPTKLARDNSTISSNHNGLYNHFFSLWKFIPIIDATLTKARFA